MTYDQIEKWIEKYVEAWRDNDVLKLADLFSVHATYKEAPWSSPIHGLSDIQKYWQEICSLQGDFEVHSKIIAVDSTTAEVHLNVIYKSDKPAKWQDVWALTFNNQKLCDSYQGWPWPQQPDS